MSRYRKVEVKLWSDLKFNNMTPPQPCGRYLFIYLMTGLHTTQIPGLSRVSEETLASELKWSLEGFREAFREVFREGMAKANWEAKLVWLPNAFKYNKPASPNVVKSWSMDIDLLPDCDLKSEALYKLSGELKVMGDAYFKVFKPFLDRLPNSITKPFDKAFDKPLSKSIDKPLTKTIGKPMPNQEQEQEQELINPFNPPLKKSDFEKSEIEPNAPRGLNLIEQPIFEFWKIELNHPDAVMDKHLARTIREAISLHGSAKCKEAIQGCKLDPWCNGTDPKSNGVIHDGLGMILKNAESVERYASIFKNRDKIKIQPQKIAEDIAAQNKITWQKEQQERKKEAEKEAARVATEKRWRQDYPDEFLFESEQLSVFQKIERRIKAHENCAEYDKQASKKNIIEIDDKTLEKKYPDIFNYEKSKLTYYWALKKARKMFNDSQKI
jgi:hypothetical protein